MVKQTILTSKLIFKMAFSKLFRRRNRKDNTYVMEPTTEVEKSKPVSSWVDRRKPTKVSLYKEYGVRE